MTNSLKTLSGAISGTQATPQTQAIPGREAEMAKNNAGGVSFVTSPWDQLDRFLILGTEGGTYYVSEQKLTMSAAQNVVKLIAEDGVRVVNRVVEISHAGRAPKNDTALFVLALAASDANDATRKAALEALPKVARIGTHLFHFAEFIDPKNGTALRGWGRALRRAVADWYLDQPLDRLANQAIKYQQRDGWSHRDLLRLSHPKGSSAEQEAILRWMVGGMTAVGATDYVRGSAQSGDLVTIARSDASSILHPQILAFEQAKRASSAAEIVKLIRDADLPREAIPTEYLNDASVWEALLVNMPVTATIRNLGKMTSIGLLSSMSASLKIVQNRLTDSDVLRKARVHPIQILAALMTYRQGHGFKGSLSWSPNAKVLDALDDAFYGTFGNVTKTGKNTLLALDVSGSMGAQIGGVPGLDCRTASAAMALITANVEDSYEFIGFTGGGGGYSGYGRTDGRVKVSTSSPVSILPISPKQRLDDVVKMISGLPFGSTDCSLPFTWALDNKIPVENFAVYTDNETYAGRIQPSQALKLYRQRTGLAARSAVVGMTATNVTIADPQDSGMLDVVGFDTNAPQIMSDFFSK